MRRRLLLLSIAGPLFGIITLISIFGWPSPIRTALGLQSSPSGTTNVKAHKEPKGHGEGDGHGHAHGKGEADAEGAIAMTPARIESANITIGQAGGGLLTQTLTAPGVIVPDSDRNVRVPAQVAGTVTEMRKRLGDTVSEGEVIAIISSREVADAKSEYLAAVVNLNLQRTLYDRAKVLWEKRVTPEQQFIQTTATFNQAELRLDLARQKLSSLGLEAKQVADEAKEDAQSNRPSRLRTYEVKAPRSGRIVDRKVDVGAPVGREGDASELYGIADLSIVWADLALPVTELGSIREGQRVRVRSGERAGEGQIVFVSPIINQDTRSARIIASLDNGSQTWRIGDFVIARISMTEQKVDVRIPKTALQSIDGKTVVFVQTGTGFIKREVMLGNQDAETVEILFGLVAGEKLATSNTFVLKAELGKAEAEHAH